MLSWEGESDHAQRKWDLWPRSNWKWWRSAMDAVRDLSIRTSLRHPVSFEPLPTVAAQRSSVRGRA